MRTWIGAVAGVAIALGSAGAQAAVIYSNDFEANADGIAGFTARAMFNGETFLGQLTQGATSTLALDTTGYSSVALTFDLYTIQSLDGSFAGIPPGDSFKLTVNGLVLSNHTYTNDGHFPSTNPYTPSATGHLATNYFGQDHTYRLTFSLGAPGASTIIEFRGLTDQDFRDEGFGVDNIVVTATPPAPPPGGVPEPATWAMMLTGFFGAGAMVRSRRKALAVSA